MSGETSDTGDVNPTATTPAPTAPALVWAAFRRQRAVIQSLVFYVIVLAAAAYVAWTYDIFPDADGNFHEEKTVELDEALVLAALFFGVLVVLAGHVIQQRRERRGRVAAEQEARRLALEDPLTGLPNRRRFEDMLKRALGSPPAAGASHAVLMLDLNAFKRINDVYGHSAGDELLTQVGARLLGAMRGRDIVARIGGDEFAILAMHVAGPESAASIGRRVVEGLTPPFVIAGRSHQIATGIGIALYPQDGVTREEILRKADIALYRAKAEKRSALRFFEPGMDAALRERDLIETELRAAIAAGAILPHYAPQIDLRSGAITGFEALARWTHSTLGIVPPSRFIPIADDRGMIGDLTDLILRQACRDAVAWPLPVPLSVNISPGLLRDRGLGERVLAILAETGLAPARLELEIAESALVRDMDTAQEVLGPLRAAGVKIALDDFGTGYSSLYHLRNFKLDRIKIDRGFVEAMTRDRESAAIVHALIGLGSGLSLAVTAEGVEDAAQRSLLVAQGCQQAQGHLFSREVTGDEAARMLTEGAGVVK